MLLCLLACTPSEPGPTGCSWVVGATPARLVYRRTNDGSPDLVRESWGIAPEGRPPRLAGVRRGSTLDRCTLRNGDLLRLVDGVPVNDLASFYKAFEAIATVDGPHTIEVNRRDAVEHMVIETLAE